MTFKKFLPSLFHLILCTSIIFSIFALPQPVSSQSSLCTALAPSRNLTDTDINNIPNYDPLSTYIVVQVTMPQNTNTISNVDSQWIENINNTQQIWDNPISYVSHNSGGANVTKRYIYNLGTSNSKPSSIRTIIPATDGDFSREYCTGSNYTYNLATTTNPDPIHQCENHTNPIIYNSQNCQDWREAESCKAKTGQAKAECSAEIRCKTSTNPDRCMNTWRCEQQKGSVYTALFRTTDADGNQLQCFTLAQFIPTLLNYFMMFAAIIAGFLFVWAGYKYLTSKGDPSALADAKDMIMQVVIGLVILSLAFVIIQVLGAAFSGVDNSIQLWNSLLGN